MAKVAQKTESRGVTPLSHAPAGGNDGARLTIRVDFGEAGALGPGKVRLLELIQQEGSISAAGRAMDMSYRRAWMLVDSLNATFEQPLVATRHGGRGGGQAMLTDLGRQVVEGYRGLETEATAATKLQLRTFTKALRKS